jgi:acetylornithine/N-succinyldiaminopimelate aminotransferase
LIVEHLEQLQQAHSDKIVAIRGKGLLLGVELTQPAADVIAQAREQGLLVLQAGPQVLRLLPSFVTTEEEINRAMTILSEALAKA